MFGLPVLRLVRAPGVAKGLPGWSLARVAEAGEEPYPLCRCGRSSLMPRCDREPPYRCFVEEPADGPAPRPFTWDVPTPSSPALALKPNGPIRVAGGVPVRHGGRPAPSADRLSLCRCGWSRAQPLCDGSHRIAGFSAEP
ncbi:MAG: hypothetical protein KatS3mg013_1498 [Actinomycetota bacterium]|nr:MAG: hypothetical protein KatS3mg013_1498 [Actinomycetota bacterium]